MTHTVTGDATDARMDTATVRAESGQERDEVALGTDSEQPDISLPEEYHEHHPEEHPSDWGWHGEWGRVARIAGWVVAAILVVMITATHYNESGTAWLIGIAAAIVVALLIDIQRRKRAWRP
jgi:hypothetical protein